ncbi:family 10 glycosylhydrolase [bacterium]|nr:family 10 glycosylhydrolase [bacterium]
MRKLSFLLILFLFLSTFAYGQSNTEFRSTWVISWDLVKRGATEKSSKALVRKIMDNHKAANMNAVIWHARQGGTVYYESEIEPWGYYSGYTDPGFDLMAYAIQEAHKRGLEFHAWFNVFHCSSTHEGAPAAEHPEWVCTNSAGTFMTSHRNISPGIPAVRSYLVSLVAEINRKYDIDGIHFDYVRWNEFDTGDMASPLSEEEELRTFDGKDLLEKMKSLSKPSSTTATRFIYDAEHPASGGVPDGFGTWAEWRRWSVTEFVRTAYDSIKAEKPWVRLSVAALGKYNWSGWQGYGTVFQDAALWFNEPYIDQLMPMHYHWLNASDFYRMLAGPWGNSNYTECWGKSIQPGIEKGVLFSAGPASYLLKDNNLWDNHVSIVEKARTISWVDGFQFFSYATWRDMNYWSRASKELFPNLTKVRGTKIFVDTPPATPTLSISKEDSTVYALRVSPPVERMGKASWYVIYRTGADEIDPAVDEIVTRKFSASRGFSYIDRISSGGFAFKYYVTVCDRYWNESEPSNIEITDYIPGEAPLAAIFKQVKHLPSGYQLSWVPTDDQIQGFRVYAKSADSDWLLLTDETTLDAAATSAVVSTDNSEIDWQFKITCIGLGHEALESPDSDILGCADFGTPLVLIVDGFEQTDAAGQEMGHPLAGRISETLGQIHVSHETCSDELIADAVVAPRDFSTVIWVGGTSDPAAQVIDYTEMAKLASFLRYGGNLLISGSDLASNMKNGATADKKFLTSYLKADFSAKGADGNGYEVTGTSATLFDGLTVEFDNGVNGYDVVEPDILGTDNGAAACLEYSDGSGIAAVFHNEKVENASTPAKVVMLGFSAATITSESLRALLVGRVMDFFEIGNTSDVTNTPVSMVETFAVAPAYPNPFNPATTLQFSIPETGHVHISVLNTLGQEIAVLQDGILTAGNRNISWQADHISSGVYFIKLSFQGKKQLQQATQKVLLLL